ncbi:MAG: translation elongation factor 4 [Candidatus Anammoxibacter sp.]
MGTENIRNFCIIAHIDHGKSTLADRMLEKAGAIEPREYRDQILDNMDIERERGITIKASAVAIKYELNGQEYALNLIDTPGHVDFSYEVARSLGACEGAVLLVDASQGVEAQTVANMHLAVEHDLTIIPVLSKTDLVHSRPDDVKKELETNLCIDPDDVLLVSAKAEKGIDTLFEEIIKRIPAPKGSSKDPLRALVFDSIFDAFRGVIVYIRVFDGEIKKNDTILMMKTKSSFEVAEVGVLTPKMQARDKLSAGEVGYCIANIKSIHDVDVGDTVTNENFKAASPLKGYKQPSPMVYCGLFPSDNTEYHPLRVALDKLRLNDASFSFEPETSQALGFGFRCGFLGLLHMEITQERLERESKLSLVQTVPSVTYEILKTDGTITRTNNPEKLPPVNNIKEFREPVVVAKIIVNSEHIGAIMQLSEEKRGKYISTEYLSDKKAILTYDLPLAEIIFDFHDKLKSSTKGYGTLDYEFKEYKKADLVKLDILVAGKKVDALSSIVHKSEADCRGRKIVKKLKGKIDRHLFEVPIQAAIGSKVISRETIRAISKNVTAKCYGGDVTRKRKLLEKQKEGKKRMKTIGQVQIPQEAFLSILGENT